MKTDLRHYQFKKRDFQGIYRGVVEDNNDPEMLGRCKIRVWGIHTDNIDPDELEGIPTENLPWAEPCLGLIEGSVSGNGLFSIPLPGSHVFLFFEGGNWQSPRYFATVPGQPEEAADTSKGFNDPSGVIPRSDRLGEPDWHRLARGETTETVIDWRNQNVDTGVPTADGETWDEPESAYAAEYPNNIVLSTRRGITIELDSTEGAERIHIYHPSNSYLEIDADGNMVLRNDGNRIEITRGTRNKHILVDDNETIDADKTSKVGNDETVLIGHDREKTVGNNDTETIGKDRTTNVGQNDTKQVGGNWSVTVTGDVTVTAATATVNTSGTVDVTAGGPVTVTAPTINLN